MIEEKYDRGESAIHLSRWKSILLLLVTCSLIQGQNLGQVGPQGPTVTQNNQATYAVVSPSLIRPGAPFLCSVTLFSGVVPVTFTLQLKDYYSNVSLVSGSVILTAASQPMTRTLTLQVPADVPTGNYYLFVNGSGGQTFSVSRYMTVARKRLSVFIQTDKSLYKPGQTVLFRCIAVYPNLLPYKNEMNITILDKSDNKIKQNLNVKSPNGVIEDQLKLADQTPLGTWRIVCAAGGNEEIREFTVAEYVLPKFEVTVLSQSFFLVNINQPSLQKDLDITVKAMYTYGQPVKGVANISIDIRYPYQTTSNTVTNTYIAQLVNGSSPLKITLKELLDRLPEIGDADKRTRLSSMSIFINASVVETVTGVAQGGDTVVPCTSYRNKIEFLSITPDTFRRGMDFTGYLRLSQYDGSSPVMDDFKDPRTGRYSSINITATMYSSAGGSPQYPYYPQYPYKYSPESSIVKTLNIPLSPSGYQQFTMKFNSNCTRVTLTAELLDVGTNSSLSAYKSLVSFYTRDTTSGIKIIVSGTDGVIQPKTTLTFTVKTTTATKNIYYQILSKGQIVLSGPVSSLTTESEHIFGIYITPALAQMISPSMTLVAWTMTDAGEIVADSVKLTVSGGFANQVSLTFDKEKAEPGDNITLTVNSCPGSFVGILAVDKSVILLQAGIRLTQDSVSSDREEYSSEGTGGYYYGPGPGPPLPPARPPVGPAPGPGATGGPLPNPGPPSLPSPSGSPAQIGSPGPRGPSGPSRRKRSVYPWGWYSPGGSDSTQVFSNAGLTVFTDGVIYQYYYGIPGVAGPAGPSGVSGPQGSAGPVGPTGPTGNVPPPGPTNSAPDKPPSVQKTRSNFPETFMWSSMTAGSNSSSVTVKAMVPDTITSWVASAFAVDDKCGLGVADTDAKLTVFQTFFISVTSPYSVVRGEECAYLVTVFNYFPQSLRVTVTLKKSNDFMVRTGKNEEPKSVDVSMTINVPSNDAVTVYYWIVPKTLGLINFLVQAQSSAAGDSMQSTLLVKPEGVEQSYSNSVVIQLSADGQTYNSTVSTALPPSGVLVPGSQHITCTAIGDIMGPTIQGLDNLVQLPTGCGEQNMVRMAPMVSVIKYLKATGQDTKELMDKAVSYMNIGYQRELTYQHKVGSFSAFGENSYGNSGSTWLTAFVLKVFCQARQYISVEDDKMAKSMNWIIDQQNINGSFNEPGVVYNSNLPGGSAKGVAMTAYVLIALCCNKNNTVIGTVKYENSIKLGTQFLLTQINSLNSDPYTLSIVINALRTCGVSGWEPAFNTLNSKAINQDGKTHWEQPPVDPAGPGVVTDLTGARVAWSPSYIQSPSRNIELTSYVFLILAPRKNLSEYVPACKWLVSQRNSLGGYSNTQDTVMALEALAECALLLYGPSNDGSGLNAACTSGTSSYPFQTITKANSLILQQIEVPPTTTGVGITASGKGTALIQVNVKYNVQNIQNNNSLGLNTSTTSTDDLLSVTICSSWTGNAASGMCLLEVNILTGYQITNLDTLKDQGSGSVDRIDRDKEKVVLYFNQLTKTPICRTITMKPEQMVNNVQRALIKLYRYYDKDTIKSTSYQPTASPTDHCVKCPQCCQMQIGKK